MCQGTLETDAWAIPGLPQAPWLVCKVPGTGCLLGVCLDSLGLSALKQKASI